MNKTCYTFFTETEQAQLKSAVAAAELHTSGEVRLFLDTNCEGDVLDRAAFVFKELGMHKTDLRNGVLIYIATADRKFAIIGDSGINAKVGQNFWDEAKTMIKQGFGNQQYADTLCQVIVKVGESLKTYFPRQHDDINELSDDIAFGN